MAIGAVEMATVSRIQDYTTYKQNEDNKGFIDQSSIGQQTQQNERHQMQDVPDGENAEYYDRPFDARDKGDNEYQKNENQKQKKKKKTEAVVVKGYQGFDIKI